MAIATAFALALLAGATFVIPLRHGAIPRWLVWVGAVGATLSLVSIYPHLRDWCADTFSSGSQPSASC